MYSRVGFSTGSKSHVCPPPHIVLADASDLCHMSPHSQTLRVDHDSPHLRAPATVHKPGTGDEKNALHPQRRMNGGGR